MSYKTFETERLILRHTVIRDAEFIYELLNTPKWFQYIGDRQVKSVHDAAVYINNKMTPQLKRFGYSNYTLIRKKDQVKIGVCGLYDREGLEGIDIGFALLPAFEKNGYALEAALRIKKAAFEEFGIELISAVTTKENKASQMLLEKLGLKLAGTTLLPNDDEELLVYKIEKITG